MSPRFLRWTGTAASLCAVLFMIGGHWFLLQSVAWSRMLADFARESPLSEAIVKTFDGRHPCKMCRNIQEGRQQEEQQQKAPWLKPDRAPEWFVESRPVRLPARPAHSTDAVARIPRLLPDFIESPPTPPPRFSTAVS